MPGKSTEPVKSAPLSESAPVSETCSGTKTARESRKLTPFERAHESGLLLAKAVQEYAERMRRETADANPAEKAEAEKLNSEAKEVGEKAKKELMDIGLRLQPERLRKATEPASEQVEDPKALVMQEKRQAVAKLEAKLKKFEGFGAVQLFGQQAREERQALNDELAAAKKEYAVARAEFVGASAMKMLEERIVLADQVGLERNQQKGLGEKVYDVYKKMGEMSLAKIWKPKSKVGLFVARSMNVRTLVSAGLLGVGLAAGAGAGVGVGLGVLAARRMFSAAGATFGSYDLMRMVADRKAGKIDEKKLQDMAIEEIVSRMERLEAECMRNGTEVSKNQGYQKLSGEYARRAQEADVDVVTEPSESGPTPEQMDEYLKKMDEFMVQADQSLEKARTKNAKRNQAMKVAAGAVGVIVGSGLLAKAVGAVVHEVSGPKPMTLEPQVEKPVAKFAVAQEASRVEAAQTAAAEKFAAGAFQKGDTIQTVTRRLLLQDPKAYGFKGDLANKAALDRWAGTESGKILRTQGFMGEASQGHARLTRLTEVRSLEGRTAHAMLVRDAKGALRVQLDQNAKLVDTLQSNKPFSEAGLANANQMIAEAKSEIASSQRGLDNANEALRGMDAQRVAGLRKILEQERYLDTHAVGEGTARYSPTLINKWSKIVSDYDQTVARRTTFANRLIAAQENLRYATDQQQHMLTQKADWEAVNGRGLGTAKVQTFDAESVRHATETGVKPERVSEVAEHARVNPRMADVASSKDWSALDVAATATGAAAGVGMAAAHMPRKVWERPKKQVEEQVEENPNPFTIRETEVDSSAPTESFRAWNELSAEVPTMGRPEGYDEAAAYSSATGEPIEDYYAPPGGITEPQLRTEPDVTEVPHEDTLPPDTWPESGLAAMPSESPKRETLPMGYPVGSVKLSREALARVAESLRAAPKLRDVSEKGVDNDVAPPKSSKRTIAGPGFQPKAANSKRTLKY